MYIAAEKPIEDSLCRRLTAQFVKLIRQICLGTSGSPPDYYTTQPYAPHA
ncbi:hypothetical protein NSU_3030 [Novosphingobium pentaromativorans US6-1]|uniref:Uncharacterized protein n=1 Tax=Novosphingobium pentaromativorans US6-1 TaxID=1088721 RepID=G6EFA9_9SPHN|nr:hypothetical protein NSU_3030 [Novosphingobium pentaromativorans US6-1]